MRIYLTEAQLATIILEAMNVQDIYHTYYSDIDQGLYNKVVQADPTFDGQKMGKYTKWLLGLVRRGRLKEGDLGEAKNLLAVFDRYKNRVEVRDVTRVKSMRDLYDVVKPFMQGNISTSKSEEIRNIKEGAEKAYEDDTWLVVIPHTEEAACLYGKGTKWCTAADNDNMFEYYNAQGPLYININKKTGEKFQFHFQSFQFMDEEDETLRRPIIGNIGMTDGLINFYAKKVGSKDRVILFLEEGPNWKIDGVEDYYVVCSDDESFGGYYPSFVTHGTEHIYDLRTNEERIIVERGFWESSDSTVSLLNKQYLPVYGNGYNMIDLKTHKEVFPPKVVAACNIFDNVTSYKSFIFNNFNWYDKYGNAYTYTFSDGKSRLVKSNPNGNPPYFDAYGEPTGNWK